MIRFRACTQLRDLYAFGSKRLMPGWGPICHTATGAAPVLARRAGRRATGDNPEMGNSAKHPEAYDEQYWTVLREAESVIRQRLAGGTRHIFEAEMKYREQGSEPGGA
jgi:hypothetical protein